MGHLPPRETPQLSDAQVTVLAYLVEGKPHTVIANKIARGDPQVAKRWRRRMRDWMAHDILFQQAFATLMKAETALALPGVTRALVRRAQRGRVDAIKLLFELTGFYNPRSIVDHNHSGEININLTMGGRPEPVVDAEVVEE